MPELKSTWDMLIASSLKPALLPIAQKKAPIAKGSSLKSFGKVPSIYTDTGEIVGYADWANREPTDGELALWKLDARLGIGVRAKCLRAFDIDVNDAALVESLFKDVFANVLPSPISYRKRGNSSRILIPFFYEDDCPKRIYKLASGDAVELLGDGQQWVAFGTHPSGAEYTWEGDILRAPTLTKQDLEAIDVGLTQIFGATRSTESATGRQRGESIPMEDPVADFLRTSEWFISETEDRLILRCPNAQAHTAGEEGDGSTVWFKAGTNGYEQGHFCCKHAHCADIDDTKFLKLIGYSEPVTADDFPLATTTTVARDDEDLGQRAMAPNEAPDLARLKNGRFVVSLDNLFFALRHYQWTGFRIFYDEFLQALMVQFNDDIPRPLTDDDIYDIRRRLEKKGFSSIGKDLMDGALGIMRKYFREDLAQKWLAGLPAWDGVQRCEKFLADYCNVEDSVATRVASRYLWETLAGRVLTPGVKADAMLVLYGDQGLCKSSAIAAIAPDPNLAVEVSFEDRKSDIYRAVKGKLVVEIPELAGMGKKDLESLKALLSAKSDTYVEKFEKIARTYPRRHVFIGSTNEDQFLTDVQNRRFAVVHVQSVIDVDRIMKDRDQLWAEAKLMYMIDGIEQPLLEKAFTEINEQYRLEDPWESQLDLYLRTSFQSDDGELPYEVPMTASELLTQAISVKLQTTKGSDIRKVSKAMKRLGYEGIVKKRNGKAAKIYQLKTKIARI